MKRGEVWWAELPLPVGKRPEYSFQGMRHIRSGTQTVAEVTRTIRKIPVEVSRPEDGLPQRCVVKPRYDYNNCKDLLIERITLLKSDKIALIEKAIRFALGME